MVLIQSACNGSTQAQTGVDELDDLFDIANTDLSASSEESKKFLESQRMKGRPGTITFPRTRVQPTTTPSTATQDSMTTMASESIESSLGASASGITGTTETSGQTSGSVYSTTSSFSLLSVSDKDDPDYVDPQSKKDVPAPPPVVLNKNFLTERYYIA